MTSMPPQIVELLGLPRTGKTTISRVLYKVLREAGLRPYVIKERAAVCPVQDKLDPLFNLWTATAFLKEYTEAWNLKHDVVLADRGLIDALVWVETFKEHPSSETIGNAARGVTEWSLMRHSFACAYFLYAEIPVVLDREQRHLLSIRKGRIMNARILDTYRRAFDNVANTPFLPPLLCIDTTSRSIKETAEEILTDVKRKLYRRNTSP